MAQKQKSEQEVVLANSGAASAPRRKSVSPRSKTATPTTRKKHSTPQAEAPSTSSVELPAAAVAAVRDPTYDEIATLAYTYWEARGCQGGCPEEDWLRAEQELRARVGALTA